MNLFDREWREFKLDRIINSINNGISYNNEDLDVINTGDTDVYYAYITRGNSNNGIKKFIQPIAYDGLENPCAITIGDTTATIFYQDIPFVVGPHISVMRAEWFNVYTANFLVSILNLEKDKYPIFGRAFLKDLVKETIIKLPVKQNSDKTLILDVDCKYNDEGYVPDFQFMEDYIKSRKINISAIPDYFLNEGYNKACWYMDNIDQNKFEAEYAGAHTMQDIKLSDRQWEEFEINKLFHTYTGGDLILNQVVAGEIPIVSHTSDNNGIGSYSCEIANQPLFDHDKSISLADRGTFFAARQKDDFYIGTRVKAMVFKDDLFAIYNPSQYAIDFIVTVINHEQFRFCYGRNCTSGLDTLVIKLPVKQNDDKTPVLDADCKYNREGYIPDFQFMEDYIKSLPFSCNI